MKAQINLCIRVGPGQTANLGLAVRMWNKGPLLTTLCVFCFPRKLSLVFQDKIENKIYLDTPFQELVECYPCLELTEQNLNVIHFSAL